MMLPYNTFATMSMDAVNDKVPCIEKEKVVMGPHTQLEYLTFPTQMDRDVHMIYTACLGLCHVKDISLPLGQKTCNKQVYVLPS